MLRVMTSLIGSSRRIQKNSMWISSRWWGRRQKGFTLIEAILSIVILAIGIVSVQRVFLGSFTAVHVIDHWSQAERLLEEKIWDAGRRVLEEGEAFRMRKDSGLLLSGKQAYHYDMQIRPLEPRARLLMADAAISWGRQGMSRSIRRTFYVSVPYASWKK